MALQDNNKTVTFFSGFSGYGLICWYYEKTILNTNFAQLYAQQIKNELTDPAGTSVDTTNVSQPIFITSCNISLNMTRPTEIPYYNPRNGEVITDIITGCGVCNISGSVSFDMSRNDIMYFLHPYRIRRGTYFNLRVSDGYSSYTVYQCVWNNITFATNAGGLVTCSISFVAFNKKKHYLEEMKQAQMSTDVGLKNYFDRTLVSYFETGNAYNHMQSFNIAFTQQVTPVYLNDLSIMPSYLRCGKIQVSANIDSWFDFQDVDQIQIGPRRIYFNKKAIDVITFNQNGSAQTGKYSYTIKTYALEKSYETTFTIY